MSLRYPLVSGIHAAGTTQATAFVLNANIIVHVVSVTPASSGVQIPLSFTGQIYVITNNDAVQTLNVYPPLGGNLSSGVNTAYQLVSGSSVSFIGVDGLNFNVYAYGSGDEPIDQSVNTTSSPTFVGLTLSSLSGGLVTTSTSGALSTTLTPSVSSLAVSGTLSAGGSTLASAVISGSASVGGALTCGSLTSGTISSGGINTNGGSIVCGSITSSGMTTGSVSASGSVSAGSLGGGTLVVTGSASVGTTLTAGVAVVTGSASVGTTLTTGALTFGGSVMTAYTAAGSWTPVLSFGGASVGITYSSAIGVYTQIGSAVFWNMTMVITNKGSSTGLAAITLPLTVPAVSYAGVVGYYANINLDATYTQLGVSASNQTAFNLAESSPVSGNATIQLQDTNFTNTSRMACQGWFHL
jgi:hypothetical protein